MANRLPLHFKDGSLYDETLTFSQNRVFRLEAYRLTQRGPSFPLTEVAFDRVSGRYTARTQDGKDGKVETAGGELEMPDDLYNGMALTLLKNLPAGATAAAHMVAFTPKPRVIKMGLAQEGTDSARVAGANRKANRYLVKLEVGGLTGVVASLVGKDPPDLRYWLIPGQVPAFGKFEGAMFLNGPTWRIEQIPIEWLSSAREPVDHRFGSTCGTPGATTPMPMPFPAGPSAPAVPPSCREAPRPQSSRIRATVSA